MKNGVRKGYLRGKNVFLNKNYETTLAPPVKSGDFLN